MLEGEEGIEVNVRGELKWFLSARKGSEEVVWRRRRVKVKETKWK